MKKFPIFVQLVIFLVALIVGLVEANHTKSTSAPRVRTFFEWFSVILVTALGIFWSNMLTLDELGNEISLQWDWKNDFLSMNKIGWFWLALSVACLLSFILLDFTSQYVIVMIWSSAIVLLTLFHYMKIGSKGGSRFWLGFPLICSSVLISTGSISLQNNVS